MKLREPLVTNIMWRNLLIQVCGLTDIGYLLFHSIFAMFTVKTESLIAHILYKQILYFSLLQALYQIGILLLLNFQGKSILSLENDDPKHANMVKNTLIFNAFVFCQVSFLHSWCKLGERNVCVISLNGYSLYG